MLYRFTLSILMAFAAQAKANIVTTEFNVSQVPTDVTVNTTFPPFANLGGPADLTGSLYQQESGYIGMITPSGFTSSLYLGDGQYMLQMGRFLSWECTGVPGEYRATVIRRDVYSNGTIVVANRCEKGKVVAPDSYYWISSTTACPRDDEPFPEWSRTTFDTQNLTSLPSPDFGNLTCSRGSRPGGSDTRVASLGLDPAYENATGVYQLTEYPVIPPPYDEANSGVEPVAFAYPGITPAVDGIWDIVGLDAFRTIAGDGFSIVFFNASTVSFDQVLGRYESYECSPTASEGGYRSVATQSSFSQSGPVYFKSAGGCSAARFLDDAVGEVTITTSLNTTCPSSAAAADGRLQTRIVPLLEDAVEGRGGPLCRAGATSGAPATPTAVVAVVAMIVAMI